MIFSSNLSFFVKLFAVAIVPVTILLGVLQIIWVEFFGGNLCVFRLIRVYFTLSCGHKLIRFPCFSFLTTFSFESIF